MLPQFLSQCNQQISLISCTSMSKGVAIKSKSKTERQKNLACPSTLTPQLPLLCNSSMCTLYQLNYNAWLERWYGHGTKGMLSFISLAESAASAWCKIPTKAEMWCQCMGRASTEHTHLQPQMLEKLKWTCTWCHLLGAATKRIPMSWSRSNLYISSPRLECLVPLLDCTTSGY